MKTQEQKILEMLKAHPEGIHPSTLAFECKITQYNARVNGIRKLFNCECKNGYRCSSQEHIINRTMKDGTTRFFYEKAGQNTDWEKLRHETIQKSSIKGFEGLPF